MRKRLAALTAFAVLATTAAIPAYASAATYTYFNNGTMANGSHANTQDGSQYRTSNRVNRPVGKYFCSRIYGSWLPGGQDEACSSLLQPIAYNTTGAPPEGKYIGSCWNYSGTTSINVTCWANQ